MKSKNLLAMILILIVTTLSACGPINDLSDSDYTKISAKEAKEAKEMIDKGSSIIILDVRKEEEFKTGHIDGAILIPEANIFDKAEETLSDKSSTILVYCRSDRRSALAAAVLVELGYSNVYDFGGINDWNYDIVTE